MLPVLKGVPASTVQADAYWTVLGDQQMRSADHILADDWMQQQPKNNT